MTGPRPGDPGVATYPQAGRRHRPDPSRRGGHAPGAKPHKVGSDYAAGYIAGRSAGGGGGGGNSGCRFLTMLLFAPALLLLIPLLVLVPALWIPAAVATVLGLATRTNKETP